MVTMSKTTRSAVFRQGLRDGIPIGLGYFAVSFSLGIAARNAGLTPFASGLASLLNVASAGEYAGFSLIAAGATYLEIALMTLVINARYLLMSCAWSQRMSPDLPLYHRMLMAYGITDELFGIAIAREGYLDPFYSYGAMITAIPPGVIGTALGCIAGNILPVRIVSALSVALFGMFLAIIVPEAKKSPVVAGVVLLCFGASYALDRIPLFAGISEGTRTIILTVAVSAIAALAFPHDEPEQAAEDEK